MSEKRYRWPEIMREDRDKYITGSASALATVMELLGVLGPEGQYDLNEVEDLIERMKAALDVCAERPHRIGPACASCYELGRKDERVLQPVVCRHGFHVGERDPAGVFRQNTMRCPQCASELGREAQRRGEERRAKIASGEIRLFPEIEVDPSMPAGQVELRQGGQTKVTLVNIGEGSPCECGAAKIKDEPHARWCPAQR